VAIAAFCADCYFDEAHQLNETGVQFLGNNPDWPIIFLIARDMLAAGFVIGNDWLTGRYRPPNRLPELRLFYLLATSMV
jgi:hypothetical protein